MDTDEFRDIGHNMIDMIADYLEHIEKSGRFWISTTVLKGQSYFHINPVNFRTRAAHMEALLEEIMRECESVYSSIG